MAREFTITISIPEDWVEDEKDLKELLEKECNLWSVTHCKNVIEVKEMKNA